MPRRAPKNEWSIFEFDRTKNNAQPFLMSGIKYLLGDIIFRDDMVVARSDVFMFEFCFKL